MFGTSHPTERLASSVGSPRAEDWRTTQLLRDRGHGDLVLALPSGWLEDLGWKDGQLLTVTRLAGARLMVSQDKMEGRVPASTIDLPAQTPKEHLFRRLVSAYLTGADEITVASASRFSAEQVLVVREFCRRIPDLHVAFETKEKIVLKGVPERAAMDPPVLVRDMARRVVRLHRAAGRSWDRHEVGIRSTPFGAMDDEVDREAWLMERTLVRELALGMYFDPRRADAVVGVNYLMAAKTLERIADHAVRVGEEGRKLSSGPPELRASLATFHEQVMHLLAAAVDLLDRPEESPANELIDGVDRLLSGREAFGMTTLQFSRGWASRGSLVLPTNLVLESMRRTASYVADLGEIALDLLANA